MKGIWKMNNAQIWTIGLIIITLMICITLLVLQSQGWIIRFEMDNNTLEAIKSINWSEFNEAIK